MRESSVEDHLVQALARLGLACVKFIPDNRAGMPDRLVLLPGERVLWVETKTDGGRLSELQKLRARELRRAGQRVAHVWTTVEADALVAQLEGEFNLSRISDRTS